MLLQSLDKKNAKVDSMIRNHFDIVKQANGQPLNDKRNGAATLKKWDRQATAINKQIAEIERTERAVEREKETIKRVNSTKLPNAINEAVQSGELSQWRKYPNRFFVKGVEKGRFIWDEKKNKLLVSHYSEVPEDQKQKFKEVFNSLKAKLENHIKEAANKAKENKQNIPQSPYFDPETIQEIVKGKKLGMKYSRTKGKYYFPKGIEVPEEYKKYMK